MEYLLEKSEYNNMITEEGIHNYEPRQKGTFRTDNEEKRLADSLENYLGILNKHIEVLIEEGKLYQYTKMLPEEEEAQSPYVF